jgi:pyruvate/2-oxoglutarate dehydrogenase complex dihydrolipoamide dehydrogenase (E3) component
MGGECLNSGCVPSKALLAAAHRATAMDEGAAFGIDVARGNVDYTKVQAHVRATIAAIAPNDSAERFTAMGVRVIKATARFISKRSVVAGDYEIRARRFVIATGSTPALPEIPGLDAIGGYYTNDNIFDLTALPDHLIVIGGGAIGCELAQAFRRLGAAVTVLEAATPLANEDPEAAAIVLDQLARDGVVIRSGVKVSALSSDGGKIVVRIADGENEESVEGTHLLVATGRKPALAALNLEAAGIKFNERGILTNRELKTSNGRVFAIGDVAGRAQFTHAANYQAGIVIRNALFRQPAKLDENAIPRVTYTQPELAQTGMTESQAKKQGRVRIMRWPYHDNDRAQAERQTHGHIKVITTKKGKILGVTIVGAQAGELISLWSLAIAQGLNISAVASLVFPYPTLSEVSRRAAIDFFTPRLTGFWVRRIIGWLRAFG